MLGRLIPFLALGVWVLGAAGALASRGEDGRWLAALVLPGMAMGLWSSDRWMGWVTGATLALFAGVGWMGVPVWNLAGPLVAAVGMPSIVLHRGWRLRMQQGELQGRCQDLQERIRALEAEKGRWQESIAGREAAVQEISQLYQLAKEFLGTLEWEQASRITEEALSRWMPSLQPEERGRYLKGLEAQVRRGDVTVEALIQGMPLAGTDFRTRERWAIVSGQLALGLQRVSLYRQVQESATHDSLTGLLVRRTFRERLQEEVQRAQRQSLSIAFLMVDLDRFKQVNDSYGHLVGDVVLREVARRVRGSVREMDLVGRHGGEEFGVVLPDAGAAVALQIGERIRRSVEETPIRAYDEEIPITVSVGIALWPGGASSAEDLVEKGDQAMYRAKAEGRNRTVMDQEHPGA